MAYESTTLTTARREIGRALGIFRYGALTAAAAQSVTIPSLYLNTNRGSTQAQDETIILRPDAATAADRKRYIASVTTSSGLVTHAGTAYADTTFTSETGEEWQLNIDPDVDVLDALNYSLRFTMVRTLYMLSNVDADLNYHMQESAATDLTSVGTPTVSVVTTARRTQFGRRAVRVLSSGATEGIQTATIPNVRSHNAQAFVFGSCDVDTATISLYDVTGSAAIGSVTPVLAEEAEMLVKIPWVATPSTSKEIAIRMIGDSTIADAYYNGCGIVQQGNRRLYFPAGVSERFKAPAIFQAVPQETSTVSNIYPAHSIELKPLTEGEHFTFLFHHPDANPYGVLLHDDAFLEWPLFVEAQIPAYDLGTFSTEASTTVADAHVFIPRAVLRIIDHVILPRLGASDRWVAVRAIAQKELDDALKVRATPVIAQIRRNWGGPSGGRI